MSGIEWIVDAQGCAVDRLQNVEHLRLLFNAIVKEMDLKPVGQEVWHQFPLTQGVTGILLLQESHLTIHTFPEHQSACLNLFCCKERKGLEWHSFLSGWLGSDKIRLQEYQRQYICD